MINKINENKMARFLSMIENAAERVRYGSYQSMEDAERQLGLANLSLSDLESVPLRLTPEAEYHNQYFRGLRTEFAPQGKTRVLGHVFIQNRTSVLKDGVWQPGPKEHYTLDEVVEA